VRWAVAGTLNEQLVRPALQTVLLPENKPREVGNLVTEVKLLMRNMDA